MIKSGQLRTWVSFQSATISRDSIGGARHTWADAVSTWAHVKMLAGRQEDRAGKPTHIEQKAVTIRRQDTAISPAMRVSIAGAAHRIVSIDQDIDGAEYLKITCEADQ